MDEQHRVAVQAIAAQVEHFYRQGTRFKVYHGSTNSTRILNFDQDRMVDVSALNRVLTIDRKKQIAVVEPNVAMDTLVDATLAYGLVPPVVMEFPGITVGGGLQGGAGESSSCKWGCFNNTLNWFDIVLGNGDVVRASRQKHADLFWGAAGSYGSFGVVTAAEVQLIPAQKYVALTYFPVSNFDDAVTQIQLLTAQDYDYVDGIMYSKDNGVLIAGRMVSEAAGLVQRFSRAWDNWFYLHARKLADRDEVHTEYIPLRDYLFRYDRGAFWMARHAFTRFNMPFNAITRLLLDPLMHTRPMYEALQASGISQEYIVQDLAMPAEHTFEFLNFVDRELHIYPLWLCPLKVDHRSPLHFNQSQTNAVINVGVWGGWNLDYNEFVAANRKLEAEVHRLHGRKWLYAYAFYTKKEFWSVYDKSWFDALRQKYHCDHLPDVFEKTCSHSRQRVSGRRGVIFALLGKRGIKVSPRENQSEQPSDAGAQLLRQTVVATVPAESEQTGATTRP